MTLAETFFTYGPGIPRYVALWTFLLPLGVLALVAGRVHWAAIVAFVATTLPSFFVRSIAPLAPTLRYVIVTVALVFLVLWTVRRTADRPAQPAVPASTPWLPLLGLAVLTVALRAPLAWIDPGISPIGLSTEYAVGQLLDGVNPYALPNPYADFVTYQYPVGTVLANLPLVALMPDEVLGEAHLGIRATSWLVDVLIVAVLVVAGARSGRVTAGLVAGAAYAFCPPLVRESGLVTANDLLLALFVVLAVAALCERRHLTAGIAVGLAIAVKPPAVLLLPFLLGAIGVWPALVAATVPLLLQLPLLVWQSPGWRQLEAFAEPAGRSDGLAYLANSVWYPLFTVVGGGAEVLRLLAVVGILTAAGAAFWAGRRAGHDGAPLSAVAAGAALPLLIVFALAPVPRLNYQDWYLPPLLLCLALTTRRRSAGLAEGHGTPAEPLTASSSG